MIRATLTLACLLFCSCRSADPEEPPPAKSKPPGSETKRPAPQVEDEGESSTEVDEAPWKKRRSKAEKEQERQRSLEELRRFRKANEDWWASKPKEKWKRPVTKFKIGEAGEDSPECEVHGIRMEKWRIKRVHEFVPLDSRYHEEKAKSFPHCDCPDVTDPIRPSDTHSDRFVCKKCCVERDKYLGIK